MFLVEHFLSHTIEGFVKSFQFFLNFNKFMLVVYLRKGSKIQVSYKIFSLFIPKFRVTTSSCKCFNLSKILESGN